MRGVVNVGVVPHPPVLVPEIGGERLREIEATRAAMKTLAAEVTAADPGTVVIISPHGDVMPDAIGLAGGPRLEGDFESFGRPDVRFACENDLALARAVARLAGRAGVPLRVQEPEGRSFARPGRLPHSFLVPWYYLVQAGIRARALPVTMALLPPATLHRFGRLLAEAAGETGTRVTVLASGDLSHRLTRDAPAGYHPDGRHFDDAVIGALRDCQPALILDIDEDLAERAGECGWRPIMMALGALEGRSFRSRVLSYEGPFGVGYGVVLLTPGPEPAARGGTGLDLTGLARQALATYLREGRRMDPPPDPGPEARARAGVFVSMRCRGKLRGCIGTVESTTASVAHEVIGNAIRAGTADPRFPPVTADEMDDLDFSVDVLGELEAVESTDDLDPRQFGLVVRRGARAGLLLPALEGVDTPAQQLRLALEKAGLPPDATGVRLYRFRTTRYRSPAAPLEGDSLQ